MSVKSSNETLAGRSSKPLIEIFSTCPQSSQIPKEDYLKNVADVARWSEQYGCKGILVYTDNSLVDPWLVSQLVIQSTTSLCPLVAVQPVYMHPYTVAKMAASYGYLFNRQIFLNMVAGGFKNDLNSLNDPTPHDRRYDRMIEYVNIIKELLSSSNGISYEGEFYKVDKLKMTPPLPPELFPGIFVSGSSEAGLAAAKAMGATAVKYPKPPGEYENELPDEALDSGVRVGIITREDEDEAWRIAHERFPEDRKGELTHQLAMKVSDSVWHKQLSDLGKTVENNPYWLVPFQHYKTFCPYLVGSYAKVAAELSRYIVLGFQTFILDIPPSEEELYHTGKVFKLAAEKTAVKGVSS
jgi:alkanesulfonate monooxygenase